MFRSFKYIGYDTKTKSIKYELTDSHFRSILKTTAGWDGVFIAIAKEYVARNLQVGRNMAMLCLYAEKWEEKMEDIIFLQDKFCPRYIDNWADIAAERDLILDKLSAMK